MKTTDLTTTQLAGMMDHTFLKPFGTEKDIERLCAEARHHGFGVVMVNPAEIEHGVSLLKGSGVKVGCTVGFPLGQNTAAVKAYEAQDCLERGAREVDMVINVRALAAGRVEIVRQEIVGLVAASRGARATNKIILENCYLTDDQKRTVCRIAVEEGADFVKTSTGFGTGGATIEDVRLMREAVGPTMGIKAAGGIRTLAALLDMVTAGATRIGTSSAVTIMEEFALSRRA